MALFYQCPDCGYKQKSEARKRIKCHRCGRSYKPSRAHRSKNKNPDVDEEKGTGFHKYSKESGD
ncbi:MAG: hypothetical protein ABEJ72_02535 [Candidatus Aenigmatarchaeota archaeon]